MKISRHANSTFLLFALILTLGMYAQETTISKVPVNKEMKLPTFHAIEVSGLAQVYIKQGAEPNVVLEVAGMPIEEVKCKVENGVLSISTPINYSGESVKIYVAYDQVNAIVVKDAAELFSENTIRTATLQITVQDRSNAVLELDVNQLDLWMKDSADLRLSGTARKQNIFSRNENGTFTNRSLSAAE